MITVYRGRLRNCQLQRLTVKRYMLKSNQNIG